MNAPTQALPVPAIRGFEPRLGFSHLIARVNRLNIFGLAENRQSAKAVSVRELWWDGGSWNFTDHGYPAGTIGANIGSQSAVCPHGSNKHFAFVFVFFDEADPAGHAHLWARYWNDVSMPLKRLLAKPFTTNTRQPVFLKHCIRYFYTSFLSGSY